MDDAPAGVTVPARAGTRRRRGLLAAGAGMLVGALAVGVPYAVRAAPRPAGQPEHANVVFAFQPDVARPWQVLDPRTGRYRTVNRVLTVSAPTTDLRYAMVDGGYTSSASGGELRTRVGRYDSWNGTIQWHEVPGLALDPLISPDGRYAVAEAGDGRLILIDLCTWTSRAVRGSGLTVAGQPMTGQADLAWDSDSRHLLIGWGVFDLDGHDAGTPSTNDNRQLIVLRPDGGAVLENTAATSDGGSVTNPAMSLALVDPHGPMSRTVVLTRVCPVPLPGVDVVCDSGFLAWRGQQQALFRLGGTGTALTVADFAAGTSHQVTPPVPVDNAWKVVVARVVRQSDVVRAATF